MSVQARVALDKQAAIEVYFERLTEMKRLEELAEAAFMRWFEGTSRSSAAAVRLANRANYASADLAAAEVDLRLLEIDPESLEPAT